MKTKSIATAPATAKPYAFILTPEGRANWLRRLRNAAIKIASRQYDNAPAVADWHNGDKLTLENLNAKIAAVSIGRAKPVAAPMVAEIVYLFTSSKQDAEARKSIGGSAMDKCQWYFVSSTKTGIKSHVWSVSKKSGRGWKTVTHANHTIRVQSFAVIAGGKTFDKIVLGVRTTLPVPAGFRLEKDNLGLKIVRESDLRDWHINERELATTGPGQWAAQLVSLDVARDEDEQRKLNSQRHRALFLADAKTTRVTMQDSRRVGNCAAGTVAFAERLGIANAEYNGLNAPGVRAELLLRTGDSRAERAAWERETLVAI